MVEKHMRTLLIRKVENWASSIDDETVAKVIRTKTIITGGCMVSMMQNEEINDFDIYFKDFESAKIVAGYYIKKFNEKVKTKTVELLTLDNINNRIGNCDLDSDEVENLQDIREQLSFNTEEDGARLYCYIQSSGFASDSEENTETFDNVHDTPEMEKNKKEDEEQENPRYVVRYISSNAITLSDKIQVVTRFYGEPAKIHNTYDFIHTKAYYTSWDKKLEIPKEVYHAVINKSLQYTGSRYPIASLVRTRKFIQRGWSVNAGQYLKMAYQISKLDLDSIPVLQDQLVGVDSAYFMMLITALKSNSSKEIDYDYLCNLIDRIF